MQGFLRPDFTKKNEKRKYKKKENEKEKKNHLEV